MSVKPKLGVHLLHVAMLTSTSAVLAILIVIGGDADLQKIWGAGFLAWGLCLVMWGAKRSGFLTFSRLDRWAWAILLSHTVFTSRIRDPRDILDTNAPTADIALEIGIWIVIFGYAGFRLMFDLRMLRGLNKPSARLALLFLVVAIGSTTYAANPLITMAWSFKLLTSILMGLVLVFADGTLSPEERFTASTYTGLCLMLVQFALLGALSPLAAFDRSEATGILRLGGYILPATQMAAVCGMVVTLGIIDIFTGRRTRATVPVLVVSSLALLLSLGRSGMIATILALSFVFLYYKRASRILVVSLAVLALAVAIPGVTDTAWDLISRKQTADQIGSLTGRVQLWETAIELISERPFLGWGYVSGSRIAFLTAFRWWPAIHTHNAILEALLTLGLVGSTLLVSILLVTLSALLKALRASAHGPTSSNASLAKMLALLILITADGMFTSGFGGAPRFEAVILFGASLCIGAVHPPKLNT
jgi:O-antigen ligase